MNLLSEREINEIVERRMRVDPRTKDEIHRFLAVLMRHLEAAYEWPDRGRGREIAVLDAWAEFFASEPPARPAPPGGRN